MTKLHLPSLRSQFVRRDRILQMLQQGATSRLILVSAPAGFGKTTALVEWAQQLPQGASWLALDERDNDPTRFWRYVIAALQKANGEIGEATLSMLQSPESFPIEASLTPLLNELTQLQTQLTVVLDDYHLITKPVIHAGLTFMVEHLPEGIQVAIATRTDPPLPLARWRVRAELTELRAADLRFTREEATTFLQQSLPLSLSEPQLAILQRQTEGWIAGLQLAMISLRHAANPGAVIDAFGGNQPYVLEYLVEEVFNSQPPPLRDFLVRTSILEQMCGDLCAAVVGGNGLNEAETLEQLERHHLFVVPLDRDRHWYRYHHLFAEALRHLLQRLEPDRIPTYHDRAAQWYDLQGQVVDAIEHAIAAQRFDYAARLIEQEMQTQANPRLDEVVVRRALAVLPAELLHRRPWLLVAKAWVGFTSSQFAEAIAVIQTLEALLEEHPPETENFDQIRGLITALKGMQARQQGHSADSVAFMEKALQLLPQDYSWLRSLILLNLGVTYFVADHYEAAQQLLPEVSRMGQARGSADPAIAGLYLEAQFLALRGRLDDAVALCQQGLELATERRWLATYAGVLVQVALADLLRQQNQLDAAAHHLTQSIDRAIENHQPGLMMGYITLARVRQAQGNGSAAWAALRQAERCQVWLWPTVLSVAACKARLHLAEGNATAAMAWAEDNHLSVEDELGYNITHKCPTGAELEYLTFARVLLAYGQQQGSSFHLEQAFRLLTRLQETTRAGGRTLRVMETLLLQALVLQAQGHQTQALDYLDQALVLPCQSLNIRLFLDEGLPLIQLLNLASNQSLHADRVNRILAAVGEAIAPTQSPNQSLIEPLSDRELEVLTYLATGMTNQAIADILFVSLAAVKWHARNIYGKLAVKNRTQAVAKARELRILQ